MRRSLGDSSGMRVIPQDHAASRDAHGTGGVTELPQAGGVSEGLCEDGVNGVMHAAGGMRAIVGPGPWAVGCGRQRRA